jgi:flagellar basal body-associated protein FliL
MAEEKETSKDKQEAEAKSVEAPKEDSASPAEDKEAKPSDEGDSAKAEGEESYSLENIDDILQQEDPEFASQMSEIESDEEMNAAEIESINIDEEELSEDDENNEEKAPLSERFPKLYKYIDPIISVKEKIQLTIRHRILRLRNSAITLAHSSVQGTLNFVKNTLPDLIKYLVAQLKVVLGFFKAQVMRVKNLDRVQKAGIIVLLIIAAAAGSLINRTLKGGWINVLDRAPIIDRFDQVASKEFLFNPEKDLQLFYEAFPQEEHSVIVPKIKINLKRVQGGGSTPMGAFELFINVDSIDTAIEVKDRDREFSDLIQREMEEFSYPELKTNVGKKRVKRAIKNKLNQHLNQGRVTGVFFKMFIIKP